MTHLAILALATLQLPQAQPTQAEVVFRVNTRYEARTETGVPLRISTSPGMFIVDSMRASGAVRRVYTRQMQVDVDAGGIARELILRTLPPGLDSTQERRFGQQQLLIGSSVGVVFPEERVARVYRVLPATRLRVGERWSEPIEWRGERYGVRANERGTRTTTIVHDTLIDGRVFWAVRDSIVLQRQDAWPEYSFSLMADVAHGWESAGTLTGRWIYDPVLAIAVARADTLRLEGVVTRSFPFGRSVEARNVITRYETWTALSAQQYDEWSAAEFAERSRRRGGMVYAPSTPVEERIAQADTTVLDSLVTAWRVANTEGQLRIERDLMMWRGARETVHRRMKAAALQTGDTLAVFSQIVNRMRSYAVTFDHEDLQFMLGYLKDPARGLRSGINVDASFDAVFYTLMRQPPALAHDTANVCRHNVCEILERYENRGDVDPRLRDLAVIARYYQNPRDGFPALEARAQTGTAMVQRVHRSALGYPSEWGQPGEGGPFPAPGTDWQEWAAWLGPDDIVEPALMRLYSIRTGRSFTQEFEAGYRSAQADTARFVFGLLLAAVDSTAFGSEDVVQLLTAESPALNRLGQRVLRRTIRNAQPAPDEVAAPLLDDLIAMLFEGRSPPWQNLGRQQQSQSVRAGFIISDSLSHAVQERWRDRINLISRAEWNARDRRLEGGGYTLRANSAGPFVMLRYDYDGRLAVEPDAAPYLFAAGTTVVLLRIDNEWRVVSQSSWIT